MVGLFCFVWRRNATLFVCAVGCEKNNPSYPIENVIICNFLVRKYFFYDFEI